MDELKKVLFFKSKKLKLSRLFMDSLFYFFNNLPLEFLRFQHFLCFVFSDRKTSVGSCEWTSTRTSLATIFWGQWRMIDQSISSVLYFKIWNYHIRLRSNFVNDFLQNVEEACISLLPNVLCKYLHNLSEYYNKFQFNCQVQILFSCIIKPLMLWSSSLKTMF